MRGELKIASMTEYISEKMVFHAQVYFTGVSHSKGIFFAGAATGPKTIPETLNEARAAAMAIDHYFKQKA